MKTNEMIEIFRERHTGTGWVYGARLPGGSELVAYVGLAAARKCARAAAGRWSVTHGGHRPGIVETWRQRELPAPAIPACAASMGCLCAGHACGDAADAPCDTNEDAARARAAGRGGRS